MRNAPPAWAINFLRWFCREDYIEEIEGDLVEIFERESGARPHIARFQFVFNVFHYLRPRFLKSFRQSNLNPTAMFRHNMMISYRNSRKYKASFLINLVGLSTGLACALLIYLWVFDEMSMNKFHSNDARLYQVLENVDQGGGVITRETTSGPMGQALALEMPEVEKAVTTTDSRILAYTLSVDDNSLQADGIYVTRDFFNVFSFPLLIGNTDKVLADKNNVVISEKLATSLFGSPEKAVGQSILWQREISYTVSGVFHNIPANSTMRFDFALSFESFVESEDWAKSWFNTAPQTYVLLKEGADLEKFNASLKEFLKKKTEGNANHRSPFITRFSDLYLYGHYENGKLDGGRIDYVKMFSIIAVFILIIACINFMNLSTARAGRRTKEVGMKKALGASRGALVTQYLTESFLITTLAGIIAVLLIMLVLPQFNVITGKDLALKPTRFLVGAAVLIVALTGLVSGSYPAFYLSRFSPVSVLKGKVEKFFGEVAARRVLVIFQFALAVVLIVCVVVVYQQMDFIQSKNLGYNKDNILIIEKNGELEKLEKMETFIQELRKVPGVVSATSTSHDMTGHNGGTYGLEWPGKDPNDKTEFERMFVNFGMIEMLDIQLKEGRIFSEQYGDEKSKIIFNEAAIAFMGMKDPLGKKIKLWGEDKEIVGVVKDFHYESLHERVKPAFIAYRPDNTWNIMVKVEAGKEASTIDAVSKVYAQFNPGFIFDYQFLDAGYQELYEAEKRVSVLSKYFAGLAILISCLGLFGLSSFTTEMRVKEIGIRKILGLNVLGIVLLLTREFTVMVITAIIIALPLSYFIVSQWLEGFEFRIDLSWWLFAAAGVVALIIAWITVASQTFKASRINPAQCLRSE